MANFFIDRPIFAWVVAILLVFAGAIFGKLLPVSAYPQIAPPQVTLTASYPGASAETVNDTVTSLIEDEMNGMEGLKYVASKSSRDGSSIITIVFDTGTDIDIAAVDVQNRLKRVEPRLPTIVQTQGVNLDKTRPDYLMIVSLFSPNETYNDTDIADYIDANIIGDIRRIDGVGTAELFGSEYAMRVWLDPKRMESYGITANEILDAISSQNAQLATGEIGGLPYLDDQQINATVLVPSRLKTAEEFGNIIVRSSIQGALVRLKDVADVEQGADRYTTTSLLDGRAASAIGIKLSNSGNALKTAKLINQKLKELEEFFPDDLEWVTPYDTSLFVDASIAEVEHTLVDAVFLVLVVMFVFLQSWRTTIIPLIVIPVSLIGTFSFLYLFGFSINMLTLFGMILAIGIVVDDAILVVENVERIISEEGLSPYKATKKAMSQISGAIIGTTAVLVSVFIPMAFFGGSVGEIFKQFSFTVVVSVVLSAVMALSLTPAVCQSLLIDKSSDLQKAKSKSIFSFVMDKFKILSSIGDGFNKGFFFLRDIYISIVKKMLTKLGILVTIALFIVIILIDIRLFAKLPSSFVPSEDQGFIGVTGVLPPGATRERALELIQKTDAFIKEQPEVERTITIPGFGFLGVGQNVYLTFAPLKPWEERIENEQRTADEIIADIQPSLFSKDFSSIGTAFAFNIPAIPGLGTEQGFDLRLQDRGGAGLAELEKAAAQLVQLAQKNENIANGIRINALPPSPQVVFDIDRDKARSLGVDINVLNATLQTALGSAYVNDYVVNGNVRRVWVQINKKSRSSPEQILDIQIPNSRGGLVDLSEIAQFHWTTGDAAINSYNGIASVPIIGSPAAGISSGAAMQIMTELIKEKLSKGVGFEWSGQSLEESESSGRANILLIISVIIVFLALSALYESWSIPVAVLLVVPLGVLGCLLGTSLSGLDNDVYFKVGLITIIGLSAKNAIMIVEFARELQDEGKSAYDAVIEACHIRFRPIMMTSLAFVFGVLPLVISEGAGAATRQAIGVGVFYGMISTAILAIFFVPVFYLLIQKIFPKKPKKYEIESDLEISHEAL